MTYLLRSPANAEHLLAALTHAGSPVFEYTALQVKQAVVGNGHADKTQVMHMVTRLLRLPVIPSLLGFDPLLQVIDFEDAVAALVHSVLTRAGVPILNTISITAHISGNILYKEMWLYVYEEVRQGKKVASALAQSKLMPSSVVQMIRSGEDSGNMADVLRDISSFYGRELKAVIKAVTSMIEPIMIGFMGVGAVFLIIAILMPYMNLFFKETFGVPDRWLGLLFAVSAVITGAGA